MAYLPRWIARGLSFKAQLAFTAEQEARIREIVGTVVASMQHNQSRRRFEPMQPPTHISVTPSEVFAAKVRSIIDESGGDANGN